MDRPQRVDQPRALGRRDRGEQGGGGGKKSAGGGKGGSGGKKSGKQSEKAPART